MTKLAHHVGGQRIAVEEGTSIFGSNEEVFRIYGVQYLRFRVSLTWPKRDGLCPGYQMCQTGLRVVGPGKKVHV
jgi:hypothetical protein